MVEAGNLLFRAPEPADAAGKERAALILEQLGALGLKVMVAGPRDLSAGHAFLSAQAKKANVAVVSANLKSNGKLVFPPSAQLSVAGKKVAVIGLTAPGPLAGDAQLEGGPIVEALRTALASLGPRDLTVVLAALPYADALQLDAEFKGQIDLIIQSGDGRGTLPPQRLDQGALLLASGQRGQAVGLAELSLSGKGPLIDLSEQARHQQQLEHLDAQLKTILERRAKIADAAARKDFDRTVAELKQRRAEQAAIVAKSAKLEGRAVNVRWLVLDSAYADDPRIKAEVLKVEPTYAGQH